MSSRFLPPVPNDTLVEMMRNDACLLVTLCLLCSACNEIAPSGKVTRREMALQGFDRVEVSHSIEADVRQGKEFRVEIEADDASWPYLDIRTRGDRLVLGMKEPTISFRNVEIRATVTMPELKGVNASGASRVTLDDFASDDRLEIESSGASRVEGDLDAGDVRVRASGASNIKLGGHGLSLRAEASGASHEELADFRVGDADVNVSGASTVSVNPKGRLNAEASGASHVTYYGNPKLGDVRDSGASSIRSGD